MARSMVLPVRRLGEEEFRGEAGRLLLAGNALHADLAPEAAGSGAFGWLMSMLGQDYGFLVPAGGAGELTRALVQRLERRGGVLRCGEEVTRGRLPVCLLSRTRHAPGRRDEPGVREGRFDG